MYHHFHPLSMLSNLMEPEAKEEDKDWRTIAVLRSPMVEPSAATIKKYLHNQEEKGSGQPPVIVRLSKEEQAALQHMPSVPRVREVPKNPVVLPPPNEAVGAGGAQSQAGKSADTSPGSATIQADPNAGKKGAMNLPPIGQPPKTDTANNTAPGSIPNGIKTPPNVPQPAKDAVKVFEDEQKAIHESGSGVFDTKGFPLGDYIDIIKEMIKGNWFIPSNLKNSQGHTTIIFYIGKDGRFTDARIEPSTSSGNTSLDRAALKAILDSKFPPLPKGFPGDHVGAKFVLSYNEP
jgi:TonB family protein